MTNITENKCIEQLRIRDAFWFAIFGLVLTAGVLIFLVVYKNHKVDEPTELVAIIGMFTSL